jgi:hypothetical protein
MAKRKANQTAGAVGRAAYWGTPSPVLAQRLLAFIRTDLQHCTGSDLSELVLGVLDMSLPYFTVKEGARLRVLTSAELDLALSFETSKTENPERNAAALRFLTGLQTQMRQGFRSLKEGETWLLPGLPDTIGLMPLEGGAVGRHVVADAEVIFLLASFDIITTWWQEFRECPGCAWLYLPKDGRQRYCTPECSWRVRWERFAATRKRDYSAEYAQRVRKHVGRNAKPRKRSKAHG